MKQLDKIIAAPNLDAAITAAVLCRVLDKHVDRASIEKPPVKTENAVLVGYNPSHVEARSSYLITPEAVYAYDEEGAPHKVFEPKKKFSCLECVSEYLTVFLAYKEWIKALMMLRALNGHEVDLPEAVELAEKLKPLRSDEEAARKALILVFSLGLEKALEELCKPR